jgi:hypothetical protein
MLERIGGFFLALVAPIAMFFASFSLLRDFGRYRRLRRM